MYNNTSDFNYANNIPYDMYVGWECVFGCGCGKGVWVWEWVWSVVLVCGFGCGLGVGVFGLGVDLGEPSEPSDQVTKTIKYMKVVCQQSGVDLCDCYRAIGGYKIRSSVRVTYSGFAGFYNLFMLIFF
uniref:Uncharacterized protein n=1 Tax=Rhizophagus irregularis (strain DAOM 181602 / DAOM 197198 / MUCL 43194) TaxID=747089 RepID=U9TFA3_RHIID